MRARFASLASLRQRAREDHLAGTHVLKRWFINKYQLPPTHDLFVNQSEGELMLEMFGDLWQKRDELHDAINALDEIGRSGGGSIYRQQQELFAQLNAVNRALEQPEEIYDPLIAKWEADVAAGRTPDLEAGRD